MSFVRIIRALWALFTAFLLLSTPVASSAQPGDSGDLAVFRWIDDGGRETYQVHSEGTGKEQLANNAPYFASPRIETAISPDGLRVAFEAGGEFHSNIFVASFDSDETIRLTRGRRQYEHPSWSPDGRKIVADCARQLCVMNSDGSGSPVNITHNRYSENSPEWSPNGKRIVFETARGLMTIRPDGTRLRKLTRKPDGAPTWAPDSRHIVFIRRVRDGYTHLWRMDSDGSNEHKITRRVGHDDEVEWAPDGSRLVFVRTKDPVQDGDPYCSYIWTVSPDGEDPERLTDCFPQGGFGSYHPVWSPDGLRIAFCLVTRPAPGAEPRGDVWTMDTSGGTRVNLTNETEPYTTYFGLDW